MMKSKKTIQLYRLNRFVLLLALSLLTIMLLGHVNPSGMGYKGYVIAVLVLLPVNEAANRFEKK